MVVTISHSGYIKRLPITTYKKQGRGGKGIIGAGTKEEDFVEHLFIASTHSYILFFTDKGKVYWLKVHQIPEASRQARGKAIVNMIGINPGEWVSAFVPVRQFDDAHYLALVTKKGIIKKTSIMAYARPRASGIIAINLDEGDSLVNALLTDGNQQLMIATRNGMAAKFHESDARPIGRTSRGVKGITLRQGDEVVGAIRADDQKTVLTVTENGYGKRTNISEYRRINRGGVGVINIQCSERNGKVTSVKAVDEGDELMLISQKGIIIRTSVKHIACIGRNTQGVRLMKLNGDDKVVSAAKIVNE
jgi:DNA gyrase subunit A